MCIIRRFKKKTAKKIKYIAVVWFVALLFVLNLAAKSSLGDTNTFENSSNGRVLLFYLLGMFFYFLFLIILFRKSSLSKKNVRVNAAIFAVIFFLLIILFDTIVGYIWVYYSISSHVSYWEFLYSYLNDSVFRYLLLFVFYLLGFLYIYRLLKKISNDCNVKDEILIETKVGLVSSPNFSFFISTDGKEKAYKVLSIYEGTEKGKKYIIYTDQANNVAKGRRIYLSTFFGENFWEENIELCAVESTEEKEVASEVIKQISINKKENNFVGRFIDQMYEETLKIGK